MTKEILLVQHHIYTPGKQDVVKGNSRVPGDWEQNFKDLCMGINNFGTSFKRKYCYFKKEWCLVEQT